MNLIMIHHIRTGTWHLRSDVVVVAIWRYNDQISTSLPSTILTRRGTCFTASEAFNQFLEKSLYLSELTLPITHLRPTPTKTNFWLLLLTFTNFMLHSVREFGAFLDRCNEISNIKLVLWTLIFILITSGDNNLLVIISGRCLYSSRCSGLALNIFEEWENACGVATSIGKVIKGFNVT